MRWPSFDVNEPMEAVLHQLSDQGIDEAQGARVLVVDKRRLSLAGIITPSDIARYVQRQDELSDLVEPDRRVDREAA